MTDDELLAALSHLATRFKTSITEIDQMARLIVQADYDPLPPEAAGERFHFSARKLGGFGDDFLYINPTVPPPNAVVDLRRAALEYISDVRNVEAIYASRYELTTEAHCRLLLNHWHWHRFWAVRHPDPRQRERHARSVQRFADTADRAETWLAQMPQVVPAPVSYINARPRAEQRRRGFRIFGGGGK